MLAVRLNKPQFEYDIHSIVKAFYPAETVKVFEEGTKDFESDGDNPSIAIWFETASLPRTFRPYGKRTSLGHADRYPPY